MARSTDEIKQQMEQQWMQNASLKDLYGWEPDNSGNPPQFSELYSKASLENIILYIVAYCAHVIEVLYDTVKAEIEDEIATKVPGTLQWYVSRLKEFVYMPTLSDGDKAKVFFDDNTGKYTISDTLSDAALRKARVVRHAVAVDSNNQSLLLLKVAGEDSDGALCRLDQDQEDALKSYIARIKYAGVKTELINAAGDLFNCNVLVWYDALYTSEDVQEACAKATEAYIKGLPFNGEYSNMALIDHIQTVPGVKIAEFQNASYTDSNGDEKPIQDGKATPYAGYYNMGVVNIQMKCYE